MAKRIGAVITFKPGVSKARAAMAINQIRHMLDLPETACRMTDEARERLADRECIRYRAEDWETVPFTTSDLLEEYDDDDCDPVFYIP